MASYLSRRAKIERVDLGDGFWVEVKTHLSYGESKDAKRALIHATMKMVGEDQETTADIDTVEYQQAKVFAAIVAWNLTDDAGIELPLSPESARLASINLLDDADFDKIAAAVEGIKDKKPKGGETEKKFPR